MRGGMALARESVGSVGSVRFVVAGGSRRQEVIVRQARTSPQWGCAARDLDQATARRRRNRGAPFAALVPRGSGTHPGTAPGTQAIAGRRVPLPPGDFATPGTSPLPPRHHLTCAAIVPPSAAAIVSRSLVPLRPSLAFLPFFLASPSPFATHHS